MNGKQMADIVEQYTRLGGDTVGDVKVIQISDWKSVFVETIDGVGRSIVMTEFKVGAKTYFAGFSTRSQTVFVSRRS